MLFYLIEESKQGMQLQMQKQGYLAVCLVFVVHLTSINSYRIVLTDKKWKLQSANATKSLTLKYVAIPGDVYFDLYQAGQIPDPYLGFNDVELRWIAHQNWTYSRYFQVGSLHPSNEILLVSKGLDTLASLYLNGHMVSSVNNMFHEHKFNITRFLHRGRNEVRIDFQSAVQYAKRESEEYVERYGYAVPPDCPPAIQSPSCHSNFVRKMQSSFSWDWGPAFPTVGVWREMWIEVIQGKCYIDSISAVPIFHKSSRSWSIEAEVFMWCNFHNFGVLSYILPQLNGSGDWNYTVTFRAGKNVFHHTLAVRKGTEVNLWWPRGFGKQNMYDMAAKLEFKGIVDRVDSDVISIGFRHVDLIEDYMLKPVFAMGFSFYFKVNSVRVFLKGSNWIPSDSFLTRTNASKLHFLFSSMAEANMNCLRVWGGGVYESDVFYRLADRYGILIWQDFMFAVALYPGDARFLKSVAKEVEDQVNRLKHHPSILIWAGNNENEVGLMGGWFHTGKGQGTLAQYSRDYLNLYNTTIWGVVNTTDFNSRPFVLSSPSNGIATLRDGGLSKNAGSKRFGDVHFYDYNSDAWDPKTFPLCRCATEYGYQSMPSMKAIREALPNKTDWVYFGPALLHRQHHPFGNIEMLTSVLLHFRIPRCRSPDNGHSRQLGSFQYQRVGSFRDLCDNPVIQHVDTAEELFLEDMVYLTQIHQAVAYQTESEHYRRWMNRMPEGSTEGSTMCALYWQLNDIWQAPSWSTIDFSWNWKLAHYYARRFFAPLIVSPLIEKDARREEVLKVVVVSDSPQPTRNLSLEITAFAWSKGFNHVFSVKSTVSVGASVAQQVYAKPLRDLLRSEIVDKDGLLIRTALSTDRGTEAAPENVLIPSNLWRIDPNLMGKVTVSEVKLVLAHQFEIILNATSLSLFVWLETPKVGYFSDNGFVMTRPSKTVSFYPWDINCTLSDFKSSLRLKSLRNVYL